MALQPVGPLPASTYWRRRLGLGGALLVALLLVLRACAGGADRPAPAAAPGPLSSATPSATPSAAASAAPSAAASPSASPRPTSTVPPVCGDAALRVTVEADARSYRSGTAPRFTLTVANAGPVPCRRALGPDVVEIRVLSGSDRIWSSDDCSTAKGQGVLLLGAGEARAMTVQWPGKRTAPGCRTGAMARPGTYRVSARVGPIVRQGTVFQITA